MGGFFRMEAGKYFRNTPLGEGGPYSHKKPPSKKKGCGIKMRKPKRKKFIINSPMPTIEEMARKLGVSRKELNKIIKDVDGILKRKRCSCKHCDCGKKKTKPDMGKTCPICNEPAASGDGINCRKCGQPFIHPRQD